MLTVEDNNKFDWRSISLMDCLKGNAMDTHYTIKIFNKLMEDLEEKKLTKLFEKLISPAIPVFRDMEYEGFLIDVDELNKLKAEISGKLANIEKQLIDSKYIPEGINLNSGQQLVQVLFSMVKNKKTKEWEIDRDFGFGLYPFQMTEKGQPQTSEEVLIQLKEMVDEEYASRGLNVKL